MKTLLLILKWVFGILFLLTGLGAIFDTPLFGIISIIIGLFILPPSLKVIEKKIKYTFSTPIKWTVAIAGIVLMSIAVSKSNEKRDKDVDKIVERASQEIDKGNLDTAFILIEDAKKKYSTAINNKAVDLEKDIEKSKSKDYAKEVLVKMTDEEFSKLQNDELNKPFIKNQKTLNKDFYVLLKEISPQRNQFIEEFKVKEEIEKNEEIQRKRKELIDKQFSPYDGSHRGLTRLLKENMNDPDSYEHVQTRFRDEGDNILVITKYRGNNAFGGKVLNDITARVDINGNVIEILDK